VSGSSPKDAANNFAHFLRETLSCITPQFVSAFQQSDKLYKIWFEPYARVTTTDGGSLYISVTQIFRVVPHPETQGQFKAKTQEYSYRLLGDQNQEEEILAYHWHPNDFDVKYPHLHVRSAPRVHFPTSRVCLEDFVLLLIRYYNARPKLPHAKWRGILDKNKKAFEKMATWKVEHR
jgi:hypothetical protein